MSRPVRVGTVEAAAACRARHHHLLICFASLPTITLSVFLFSPIAVVLQLWARRTDEAFSQHATGTPSQHPHAQHWLDLGFGSDFCSTGKVSFQLFFFYNFFHLFQIYFLAAILIDFGNWSISKSIFSWDCFSLQEFLPLNINFVRC